MLERIGLQRIPLVTGHRGAAGIKPENTRSAFQYAADIGCDGVELDIHVTADMVPVVSHDPAVSDGEEQLVIRETHSRIVTALPAGRGETIPALRDVFEILEPTRLYIQIELKGEDTVHPAVELVRSFSMEHRVIFTSFIHKRVLRAKELLPSVRTGVLLSCVPVCLVKVAHQAYADNIHLDHRRITRDIVDQVHRCGKALAAWGKIKGTADFDRLFDLEVDMIGSDWPDELLARRKEYFKG
ncbi:MAG: glycerophosphodiester phosphodiesterase [Spirochaetia bacterium]